MKLFTIQFILSSSPLETNIPLSTLSVVKFRIATGQQITVEMNVLKKIEICGARHCIYYKEKKT
jgi:hypothetical protein